MKQYLNSEQTAKLIELGFEKPKSISGFIETISAPIFTLQDFSNKTPIFAYSIGELIEMLPRAIGNNYLDISSPFGEDDGWMITYGQQFYDEWEDLYTFINKELIDAIYDMAVKLKEEGVI